MCRKGSCALRSKLFETTFFKKLFSFFKLTVNGIKRLLFLRFAQKFKIFQNHVNKIRELKKGVSPLTYHILSFFSKSHLSSRNFLQVLQLFHNFHCFFFIYSRIYTGTLWHITQYNHRATKRVGNVSRDYLVPCVQLPM